MAATAVTYCTAPVLFHVVQLPLLVLASLLPLVKIVVPTSELRVQEQRVVRGEDVESRGVRIPIPAMAEGKVSLVGVES